MDVDLGPGMDGIKAAQHFRTGYDITVKFLLSNTEQEIVDRIEAIASYGLVFQSAITRII